MESNMTVRQGELSPVFGVIPFSEGDAINEAEMAEIEGLTLSGQRARRREGKASPWVKTGRKSVLYSKVLRLQWLHGEMRRPLRRSA